MNFNATLRNIKDVESYFNGIETVDGDTFNSILSRVEDLHGKLSFQGIFDEDFDNVENGMHCERGGETITTGELNFGRYNLTFEFWYFEYKSDDEFMFNVTRDREHQLHINLTECFFLKYRESLVWLNRSDFEELDTDINLLDLEDEDTKECIRFIRDFTEYYCTYKDLGFRCDDEIDNI